jgi:hypothetical protein
LGLRGGGGFWGRCCAGVVAVFLSAFLFLLFWVFLLFRVLAFP